MQNKIVKCNGIEIANNKKITLIAGPCQLESEQHAKALLNKHNKKLALEKQKADNIDLSSFL